MSLMVVGSLAVVELLAGRLRLGGCRVLMIEKCFAGGAEGFGCKVGRLAGSFDFGVVVVVVDL